MEVEIGTATQKQKQFWSKLNNALVSHEGDFFHSKYNWTENLWNSITFITHQIKLSIIS